MPNCSKLQFTQERGIAWVAFSNMVGLDKLIFDDETLRSTYLAENAPVYLQNKTVGHGRLVQYTEANNALLLHISYTDQDILDILRDTQEFYLPIPEWRCETVICAHCRGRFSIGMMPCACIEHGPALLLEQTEIVSVTIWDARHDNINMIDARPAILARHFGGAVTDLEFTDPI